MIKINFNINEAISPEFEAARYISEVFQRTVPKNSEGYISIIPNIYLLGQKVKDIDIIIFGELSNCEVVIDQIKVNVKSFITTVELKSHSLTSISFRGTNFYVQYSGKFPHNVSKQSDDQKVSLMNFLNENNFNKVFITNAIFFNRITSSELEGLIPKHINFKKNTLTYDFDFSDFIKSIIYQNESHFNSYKDYGTIDSFSSDNNEYLSKLTYLLESTFTKNFTSVGEYTRKKVESITNAVLENEITDDSIIKGQPGTGKTHYLLIKALKLTENENKRIILLTFNNILTNDIKRIFSLTKFHDSYNESGFKIDTIHKFIFTLCEAFNILEPSINFISNYDYYVKTLIEYYESGLINKKEIENSFSDYYYDISWDYIFVDESQDCSIDEIKLFQLMVGNDKLILSIGYNQNVRNIKLNKNQKLQIKPKQLKQLLRQKENLLYFNRYLLNELGNDFPITNFKRYSGGEVYIIENDYLKSEIHIKLKKNLLDYKCSNYDLMFLVPPNLVQKDSGFIDKDKFESLDIPIWDGTLDNLRNTLSPSNSHRVLQYDSSRGIEAWVTCLLYLDDFYEYKWNQFNENYYNDSLLSSFEEQRIIFVNNWMQIVLTRSIDTSVITIRNRNSKLASILKHVSKSNDFIHYIESKNYEQ